MNEETTIHDVIQALNTGSLPAPLIKANKLWVTDLEKLIKFQLKMVQSHMEIGLNQLKAATEIENVKSLQSFLSGQLDAANVLRQKLMDDAKALVDLSTSFKADFDALVKEGGTNLAPKPNP